MLLSVVREFVLYKILKPLITCFSRCPKALLVWAIVFVTCDHNLPMDFHPIRAKVGKPETSECPLLVQ